jgi:hypothetical protein
MKWRFSRPVVRTLGEALAGVSYQHWQDGNQYEAAHTGGLPMDYETICNAVPGAEVDGFNFFRDQNGTIIARCCWCMIGFDVTAENTATIRPMMIMHLELVHGLREGR